MILVFFNFFAGAFALSQESEEFSIEKFALITKLRGIVQDNFEQGNLFEKVLFGTLNVVLLPFLAVDLVIFLLITIGTGISILPPLIELLLFSPLGIIVIYEYILPLIRGN